MQLSDEDKLRLKILKIKFRKGVHHGVKTSIKFAKKVGLVLGLTLVSLCAKSQNITSFRELLAMASDGQKNSQKLLAMVENRTMTDSIAKDFVQDEINAQINRLTEDFLYARSDSLSSSIDRLKNPRSRTREIRRNFKDAVGYSSISSHCLATQCAADFRALKAMGLEQILPQDLKEASALCRSYVQNPAVKPFAYEVANTDSDIKEFIKSHNLTGGALIFYPRDRYNYHAVSLDIPEGEFEYNDSTDQILTSGANREKKADPVSTSYFRKKAPGRKAIIVDKQDFFISLLEKHLEGKTLAEQTAILYRGGADEFLQHLCKVTDVDKKTLIANIEKTVSNNATYTQKNDRSSTGLYLLALVPMAYHRRSGKMTQALELIEKELDELTSLNDKCEYLDKSLPKALVGMTKEEQKQFIDSLIFSTLNDSLKIDSNIAAFAGYKFWQILTTSSKTDKHERWQEVSNVNKKSTEIVVKKLKSTTVKSSRQRV